MEDKTLHLALAFWDCQQTIELGLRLGTGYDLMEFYHHNTEIKNGADPQSVDIGFQGKIICGKFVDSERPTYLDMMKQHYQKTLGDKFVPLPEEGGMLWPPGEKPEPPAAKVETAKEPEEVAHG